MSAHGCQGRVLYFCPFFHICGKLPALPPCFGGGWGNFFALNTGPCPAQKISGPGIFSPGAADKFSEIANKSLLLGEGAPVGTLGRMRGTPPMFERSRQSGIAFAPQGRRWHGAAMTDEGDHGGAPVIDGPLGTAAPTKSIVTLRRGGCPHPPVRWPPHPRYPPSSAPCGGTFPLEGGRLWDVGPESFRHGLRSRWQLCCLTDAAYPLRVLRSSE